MIPAYTANKGPTGGSPMKLCLDYGGVADYKPDGSYDYVVAASHKSGRWKYLGNHRYQVIFEGGNSRVDTYEDVGGKIIDHTPNGDYPGHIC
jgi:hypothetical protein